MFQVFSRSFNGLNLSPGERAFMKLVEGWLFTAIATGVAIAYQLLATGSHNYSNIILVAGGAAGLTVLNSFKKYLASQSDLPLPVASLATQATDLAIQEVQKVTPPVQQSPAVPSFQFTTTVPQPSYQGASLPQISMPMAAMPQQAGDPGQFYNMATQSVQAVPVPGQSG